MARSISQWFVTQHDFTQANHWLDEGQKRCRRETDSYVALQVHFLGDIAKLKQRQGDSLGAADTARKWVSAAAGAHMDGQVAAASKMLAAGG